MKKLQLILLSSVSIPLFGIAQVPNQPYLLENRGGGGTNAGTPYFNAGRALSEMATQMQRNNSAPAYSPRPNYYNYYVPPPTPQELAAQQRAAEAAQRAAAEQARQQARAAAEEAKRIEAEDRIANGYLSSAKAGAAKSVEATLIAAEQREEWKKGSNAIWNSKSKDPWADYQRKLEEWDNSLAATSEKMREVPASRSKRPVLNPDGTVTTLQEKTARDDEEWLRTIKSPHAKYPEKPAGRN